MTGSLNRAFLSLGSNIHPAENLPAAVRLLAVYGRVAAVSQVWQSIPFGFAEQPDFLNAAVLLETPLSLEELISEAIPAVERQLQRERDPANKNGPRTIDIDVSIFNDDVRRVLGKTLPDPALRSRLFVAQPLADLDPQQVDPATGESLQRISERLWEVEGPLTLRSDILLPGASGLADLGGEQESRA
jgi:2-amino-4-hydroxy-6-hydroxymethyldihydropteridine diphosphokinase